MAPWTDEPALAGVRLLRLSPPTEAHSDAGGHPGCPDGPTATPPILADPETVWVVPLRQTPPRAECLVEVAAHRDKSWLSRLGVGEVDIQHALVVVEPDLWPLEGVDFS